MEKVNRKKIKIGSEIIILRGHNRRLKAVLIDIDYLSEIGSYEDRHTVKMVKSGKIFYCVRDDYDRWESKQKNRSIK